MADLSLLEKLLEVLNGLDGRLEGIESHLALPTKAPDTSEILHPIAPTRQESHDDGDCEKLEDSRITATNISVDSSQTISESEEESIALMKETNCISRYRTH